MTENEAIVQLNFDMEMIRFNPETGETLTLEQIKAQNEANYKTYLADEMAITALIEIQQYRAIGTVEQIRFMQSVCDMSDDMLKSLADAVRARMEYEKIGTVEEFKALKEKNEPKKPKKSGVTDGNGIFHAVNGINGVPYDLCPNCEINLCTDGMFGGNKGGMKYCKNCGQALDWQ